MFFYFSIELDVADDVGTDLRVEPLHEPRAHHAEVLSQGGVEDFHEKRLVLDELVARVAGNRWAHHRVPRRDEPLLPERRLKSFLAEHGL